MVCDIIVSVLITECEQYMRPHVWKQVGMENPVEKKLDYGKMVYADIYRKSKYC